MSSRRPGAPHAGKRQGGGHTGTDARPDGRRKGAPPPGAPSALRSPRASATGCFPCRVLRAFAFGGIGGGAAGAAALHMGVPRNELAIWVFLGAMAAVLAGLRLLGVRGSGGIR